MPQNLTVDASVFISAFSPGENLHKVSKQFIHFLRKEKITIVIPILTLFEVLQGIYRLTRDPKITETVHNNFIDLNVSGGLKILNLEASFLAHFVVFHQKFYLKTSDAVIALTAHRYQIPLITWDKKLIKGCKTEIDAKTPKDFLSAHPLTSVA